MSGINRPRRRIVWAAAVVMLLMLLVPPWTYTVEGRPTKHVFYQEIIPGPKPPHCANNAICGVMVDMSRLGIQLAVWAVLFGLPLYVVSRRRKDVPRS